MKRRNQRLVLSSTVMSWEETESRGEGEAGTVRWRAAAGRWRRRKSFRRVISGRESCCGGGDEEWCWFVVVVVMVFGYVWVRVWCGVVVYLSWECMGPICEVRYILDNVGFD
ncbi:hypothetical protein Drorol1_Dr00001788 [Drosera rotundifolia]